MNLEELRQQIDALDAEILNLLNKRAQIVKRIGEIKKISGKSIIDEGREEKIYQLLLRENKGPFSDEAIKAIFKIIIQKSRELQK